ncbi:hypothetical protein IEO21_06419 [Rhodonia placenta]|uniref:Uncharacterized protein n=1 Tax=Rhodonia placenta TaxID=104341 RepID=A0A8H7U1D3_9APHY|nr:hypothetical protein IEO21_06419 [Postia placenta]
MAQRHNRYGGQRSHHKVYQQVIRYRKQGANAEVERANSAVQYRWHPKQRRKHLGSSRATDADRRTRREDSVYGHGHRSRRCDRQVGLATRAQPRNQLGGRLPQVIPMPRNVQCQEDWPDGASSDCA